MDTPESPAQTGLLKSRQSRCIPMRRVAALGCRCYHIWRAFVNGLCNSRAAQKAEQKAPVDALFLARQVERLEGRVDTLLSLLAKERSDKGEEKEEEKKKPPTRVERLTNLSKLITTGLGAVAGTAFLFYAMGFVIVSLYLQSFGVRGFELTKPAYLTAGIAFAIANILPLVPPTVLIIVLLPKGGRRYFYIPSILLILVFLRFAVLIYMFQPESMIDWSYSGWEPAKFRLSLILRSFNYFYNAAMVLVAAWGFAMLLRRTAEEQGGSQEAAPLRTLGKEVKARWVSAESGHAMMAVWAACLLAISLPVMLVDWSHKFYPELRSAVGGGQPVWVRLVLSKDARPPLFTGIGIQVKDDVTEPMLLVDESEKGIVVLSDGRSATKIDKSLIANIHYLASAPTLTATPTPVPTATPTPPP